MSEGGTTATAAPRLRQILAFLMLVLVCAVLLGATASLTAPRIEANRAQRFLDTVAALTGGRVLPRPVVWQQNRAPLCDGTTLMRGAAPGYGGPIQWLAAARTHRGAARLSGVRIVTHQETPGIAGFLDLPQAGWLAGLQGGSADTLPSVEAVSGATITSRALVRSLTAALETPLPGAPECG